MALVINPIKRFYYRFFFSLLTQLFAIFLNAFTMHYFRLPAPLALCLQTLCVLLLISFTPLPNSWKIGNIVLPLFAAFYHFSHLPTWVLGVCLLISVLTYLPTVLSGVPFYPTSAPMYQVLKAQLPQQRAFSFIDLGSGYGSLLKLLADAFPHAQFVGVEIGVLPFLISRLRFRNYPNVKIYAQSFWAFDCSRFDFVYAFLAPPPMEALWQKLRQELRSHAVFLVNSFPLQIKAQQIISVNDKHETALYYYSLSDGPPNLKSRLKPQKSHL